MVATVAVVLVAASTILFLIPIGPGPPGSQRLPQEPPESVVMDPGIVVTPIIHASVMIEFEGSVIHIDPHTSVDYSSYPKADMVLITHSHGDHFNAGKIMQVTKPSTRIFGPEPVVDGSRELTIELLRYGDVSTVREIRIEVIPAYNIVKEFHPRGFNNGYLITIAGKSIFISGDSECTEEMKALESIDLAFLPIDGRFTMSPDEAADCFRSLAPEIAVPYHQNQSDPVEIRALLADVPEIEVRVLSLP